jgi:hypothetical protein
MQFGIFNDEGIIEDGFSTRAAAEKVLRAEYADETHAEVCEICPDHPEQRKDSCEECNTEPAEEKPVKPSRRRA